MKKLLAGVFTAGILLTGAWMTFYLPNGEQLDPFYASRPYAIVAMLSNFFRGEKADTDAQTADRSASSADSVSRNSPYNNAIPLDESFHRELVEFYQSEKFPARYSQFLDRLQKEQRIDFRPKADSYIESITAEEIDAKTFALTVYLFFEDKHRARGVIPVKFLADKVRGSPIKQFIIRPEDNEFQEIPLSTEWTGFTLYDIALFGLLQYGV